MSVSLRVAGTWAELIADGTVAIPATPQAGDRMYLFARWKDFSVTATVANWTELVEFADGSISAGNGTGSVKVACWYRDWQSGDTDPTIDFSASPDNASVVIVVMQKDTDDVWLTPVAVTAAMTSWTTSSQSVSASATVDVPSSSVVMGLIGIRDDTAVMTRPTNGIDDSGGLITWNGNYVESPATHHSTTTGFDGAADLGHRLVTTGATGATLRMTGTISAAETGAALWVVQGVSTLLTPASASLAISTLAPSLKLSLTPATASLNAIGFAPQLQLAVTPAAATLSATGLVPAIGLGVAPAPASLVITGLTPQLQEQITPPAASLVLTTTTAQLQESLTPLVGALTITSTAPVVGLGVVPSSAPFVISTFAPTVTLAIIITVPTATLTLTTSKPFVLPFKPIFIDPGGDATHSVGHFNTLLSGVTGASYDPTQQVAGAGSYKFDSLTNVNQIQAVRVPGVLGVTRRVSAYFRYDAVPDRINTSEQFAAVNVDYSGSGFSDVENIAADDGLYATATPAQNSGQGTVFGSLGLMTGSLQADSQIVSVKIIYEHKYDVNTSIGITRVKWRVSGVEGPDHDNTDMPLTDTVVEVDVTGDQFWEAQYLTDEAFEVIVEARRGDTAVAHIQSIDYVKVEVAFRPPITIMQAVEVSDVAFRLTLIPKDGGVVLRFIDGNFTFYDGITKLLPDTNPRIGFSYILNAVNNLDIKVYVNDIEELSIEGASTNGWNGDQACDFYYGWVLNPGTNKNCWFRHLFIDDGGDLATCGNKLSTAKLPATANENNWNTTGGTGAVNERPLSETNFRQETRASQFRQSYTLEAADEGDVDISAESLIGYMGWAWAKKGSGTLEGIQLVVNGQDFESGIGATLITTTPSLIRTAAVSSAYPSNAAGIGMVSNNETADTFIYECGVVPAYEGPPNPDVLLPRQKIGNVTLDTIVDDLRADPPTSYEVCCNYDDFDGTIEIIIHSLDQENGSLQQQQTMNARGRQRINPGIEVRLDVTVVGVTNLQIWRRLNVD